MSSLPHLKFESSSIYYPISSLLEGEPHVYDLQYSIARQLSKFCEFKGFSRRCFFVSLMSLGQFIKLGDRTVVGVDFRSLSRWAFIALAHASRLSSRDNCIEVEDALETTIDGETTSLYSSSEEFNELFSYFALKMLGYLEFTTPWDLLIQYAEVDFSITQSMPAIGCWLTREFLFSRVPMDSSVVISTITSDPSKVLVSLEDLPKTVKFHSIHVHYENLEKWQTQ